MLKPENRPIYDKVKHHLETTGKCILITHPGRGKSFITDEYIQEANLTKVLCICPRTYICKQWTSQHSDCIQAITYQSFRIMSMQELNTYHPDLVIIDEAHHAGAPKWGNILPQLIKSASPNGIRVLALTADPVRWSDKRRDIGKEFFANCQVYGPSITESIQEGFIQPFTYVLSMYAVLSKIPALKKKAAALPIEKQEEVFTLIGKMQYLPDIVTDTVKCMQTYTPPGNHKAIIFCARINDIADAQELIQNAFPGMQHYIMHNKQTARQNKNAFQGWLHSEHAALFNIDMISEGIHTPDSDIIVMFRKTSSPNLYIQQALRGISPDNPNIIIYDVVSNAGNIAKILKRVGKEEKTMELFTKLITDSDVSPSGKTLPKQVIIKNLARPAAEVLQKIENLLSESQSWTDAEIAYLEANMQNLSTKDLHEQGLPNRTPSAIRTYILKHYPDAFLPEEQPSIPWTDIRTKWAVKFYQDGKSLDYICKLMTVEKDDLIQHLTKQGITIP